MRVGAPPKFNSLVASAQVMLRPGAVPTGGARHKEMEVAKWQGDSWGYYDRVPEYRRGVGWLGNGMSRINILAARPPKNSGDNPEPIDLDATGEDAPTEAQKRAVELVNMIAGGVVGQGQMMKGFGEFLSIAGICYLVVEPDLAEADADEFVSWRVLASDNVRQHDTETGSGWQVKDEEHPNWRDVHRNGLVVKCWRRHPRRPWEPDAPVRALLPVLDQIELLSASITATAQSKLAGAGLLALPQEWTFPPGQQTQPEQEPEYDPNNPPVPAEEPVPDQADTFVETFIESMLLPMADRTSPSAVVPLVIEVPGEYLEKIQYLTFDKKIDSLVGERLEAAIRRFASGMDMPAEALLGVADANHWTAWQIAESGVTLHIEPMSETACEALTDGWLGPALEAEGFDPDEAMVWYDSTDLRTRPDRSTATTEAYKLREASGKALRREIGLDDEDAPDEDEEKRRTLMWAAELDPTLAGKVLVLLGYITEEDLPKPAPVPPQFGGPQAPPNGDGVPNDPNRPQAPPERPTEPPDDAPTPPPAMAAALVAACDGLVYRALERSGSKLKSAAGRKVHGGSSAIDCPDPTMLHTQLDATVHADLDWLLDGAWSRVPAIASRYSVDADALETTLAGYTRALIAAGHTHTIDRLAAALGAAWQTPQPSTV